MTTCTMRDKSDRTRARARSWQDRFLDALAQAPSIKAACEAANVSRSVVYRLRDSDDCFRERWDEALENGVDELVACAFRRSLKGSDQLLTFLLKAHRSEIYDRRTDEEPQPAQLIYATPPPPQIETSFKWEHVPVPFTQSQLEFIAKARGREQ